MPIRSASLSESSTSYSAKNRHGLVTGIASAGSSSECSQTNVAVLGAGQERVAGAAEADQAVRELDHRLGGDLELAEAGAVDGQWTWVRSSVVGWVGAVGYREEVHQRPLADAGARAWSAAW